MTVAQAGRRRLWGLLIVLLVGAAMPFALDAMGAALIVADPLQPADAILVLAGETRRGNRVAHAVNLYQRGLAQLLVLSGIPMGFRTHETEVMRRHAEFLGVPAEHIFVVPHQAESTGEEADAIVPVLKNKGLNTMILVTSNYHTARAKRIFEKAAGSGGPRFLASPVNDGYFDPDGWWMRRKDAKTFLYESLKTVWTAIEG